MSSVEALSGGAANVNYCRHYCLALIGPLFVMIVGVILARTLEAHSWVDSIYWTIVTMTTIGYGDITPHTDAMKVATVIFVPVAVVSLANGITRVQMTNLRRKIRETDQAKIADKLLLREANGNPDETLTEAEFLVSVLKDNDIVDDLTLAIIRAEFRELVSTGEGAFETRVLDSRAVFRELQADGRIAHRGSEPLGTEIGNIALVNTKAFDGGYKEWRQYHWEKQVAAHARPKPTVIATPANSSSKVNGNMGASRFCDLGCYRTDKPVRNELV